MNDSRKSQSGLTSHDKRNAFYHQSKRRVLENVRKMTGVVKAESAICATNGERLGSIRNAAKFFYSSLFSEAKHTDLVKYLCINSNLLEVMDE